MKKEYPKEAVSPGTLVRSVRLDRLGVVTDAYYDEDDIINYVCFIIPHTTPGMYYRNIVNESFGDEIQGIMIEESEYDIIAYLMLGRVDLEELNIYHVPGEIVI